MKRKTKRPSKRRFFDGKPEGEVTREGSSLRLRFAFSPQRIAQLKALRAKFDPASKSWTLPLESLEKLKASPFFNEERITYHLSSSESVPPELKEEALQALRENPFA